MRKYTIPLIAIAFVLACVFFYVPPVPAQGPSILGNTVTVLKYEVTMLKFEVYYTTGDYADQWYTTFEGSQALNMASADASTMVGSFFNNDEMPFGHISQTRRTISSTFVIQSTVSYDGVTYYSTTDGTASTDSGQYAEASIVMSDEEGNETATLIDTSDADVDLADGVTVSIAIIFNLLSENVGGTTGSVGIVDLGGDSYQIHPRQPNVEESVSYT